jgi:hypothetical protein
VWQNGARPHLLSFGPKSATENQQQKSYIKEEIQKMAIQNSKISKNAIGSIAFSSNNRVN